MRMWTAVMSCVAIDKNMVMVVVVDFTQLVMVSCFMVGKELNRRMMRRSRVRPQIRKCYWSYVKRLEKLLIVVS